MGAEIDRLEVQIETKATKVNNSLDTLVTKLDKVSGALSSLNSSGLAGLSNGVAKFAQASAQLSNVKTADFTRLSKNIEKLATLNTQQIFGAASAMRTLSTAINSLGGVSANSLQVAEVAKSISKLGGVNVQRAITNLPALANAMNNLMATLSRAPQVSKNVIDMTNALANLAAQGSKVGTAGSSLNRSLNSTGTAMTAATKKAWSLSSALGSIYQKYFWIRRIGNKLWDSIKESMNYVETLNYFNAAFEQVADAAVSQWEEAGYDSANAYYESFSSRAKELTSKMTGFSINDDGTLSATGEASLGINPSKLMNYQAMFAQMSSSMGVTSETSLKLSQALTEIGADLASVKNMDFDKVWTDMASGLAGMSRTLDKYGVNIRNVNLQQKLNELGINANITALNQNDKALLRTIILLDSTRYAWGDLADTLNQPANQVRLLTSNLSNLSRTIGNLFMPVLTKVLPYINGFVIALQRLVTWVGNLLGIDLSQITSAVGSSEVDISGLIDETDNLGDSLDDADKSAKKLKSNLQGFDELNVITTQDDSGSANIGGGGLPAGLLDSAFDDIFSEYQAAWDKAFDEMENKAQAIADKIEKFFKPIKDIIEDLSYGIKFDDPAWFKVAGMDTSNLVVSIFDFFAKAIDDVDWYGIGYKIGSFLAGIEWLEILDSVGDLIWQAVKASIELWKGSFDAAPIETTIATALMGMKIADVTIPTPIKIGLTIVAFAPNIAKAIAEALGIEETIFGDSIEELSWTYFFDKLKEGFTDSEGNFSLTKGIEFTLDVLKADVKGTAELLGLSDSDNPIIKFLFSDTEELFKKIDIGGWVKTNISDPFTEKLQGLAFDVAYIFDSVRVNIQRIWQTVSSWFDTNVVEPVIGIFEGFYTRIQQIFEGLWIIAQAIWIKASGWFNENVIIPVAGFFQSLWTSVSGFFSQLWEDVKNIWGVASEWFNTTIIVPVTDCFKGVWVNVKAFFSNLWEDIKLIWGGVSDWFGTNVVEPLQKVFDSLWDGIKSTMTGAMNAIIGGIESAINFIVGGINDILGGFNKVVSWAAEVAEVDWGGVELVPTVNLPRIPAYSIGGFPEDGLFYANHNELVGQFSNGKTAVANNEQIVDGIKYGVREAVAEVLAPYLADIAQNTRETADKDLVISNDDIGKSARSYARDYYRRTGKPAYDF